MWLQWMAHWWCFVITLSGMIGCGMQWIPVHPVLSRLASVHVQCGVCCTYCRSNNHSARTSSNQQPDQLRLLGGLVLILLNGEAWHLKASVPFIEQSWHSSIGCLVLCRDHRKLEEDLQEICGFPASKSVRPVWEVPSPKVAWTPPQFQGSNCILPYQESRSTNFRECSWLKMITSIYQAINVAK